MSWSVEADDHWYGFDASTAIEEHAQDPRMALEPIEERKCDQTLLEPRISQMIE
jgi:hypothetical protein